MKKILLLLLSVVLLGAGCVAKPAAKINNTTRSNSATVTEPVVKVTKDPTHWNATTVYENVGISYPPELALDGYDADYGSVTTLRFNDFIFFTIIQESVFLHCFKQKCEDLEDLETVTPGQALTFAIQSLKDKGATLTSGKVGNMSGMIVKLKGNKNSAIVLVGKKIYLISDDRAENNGDEVFEDFLAGFKFSK